MFYIGVDFGTTNSVISYIINSEIKLINDKLGNIIIPTKIQFIENGNILFGNECNQEYDTCIIENWKILLGKKFSEITEGDLNLFRNKNIEIQQSAENDDIIFKFNNTEYSLYDITNLFINYLYNILKEYFNTIETINLISVITVPAYFNNNAKELIKKIFNNNNFNVCRVISEPVSSILYSEYFYKSDFEQGNFLIFDCGGGTTDLSFITKEKLNTNENLFTELLNTYQLDNKLDNKLDNQSENQLDNQSENQLDNQSESDIIFEVKFTRGDNNLGGENITNNIFNYISKKIIEKCGENFIFSKKLKKDIINESNKCKMYLSNEKNLNYKVLLETSMGDFCINMSKNKFIEINNIFFKKITNLLELTKKEIETNFQVDKFNIIMVGGSSKFYYFKDIIENVFKRNISEKNFDIEVIKINDCDLAISMGACYYSSVLNNVENENQILLMDSLPLSFGVEVDGGLVDYVLKRNTIIPAYNEKIFTNSDYTDKIEINIYQGESRFIDSCFYLGKIELTDLDNKLERGEMQIKISFNINNDGILEIKAHDLINLIEKKIVLNKNNITPKLNKKQLDELIITNEYTKLFDIEIENKIIERQEFWYKFKELLYLFNEKKNNHKNQISDFILYRFNKLFNNTKNILDNFLDYSEDELIMYKKEFENEWYEIIFDCNTDINLKEEIDKFSTKI